MSAEERSLFVELIRPIENRMLGTIWKILRNTEDVDDAHQETLLRLWRYRQRILIHPNPQALVLRICAQAAHDVLRQRIRRGRLEDIVDHEHRLADQNELAHEQLAHKEQVRDILSAIADLPRKQAIAVMMRIVQQEPYHIIAEALGCSEVTARSHVARGRAILAAKLSVHIERTGKELPS